MAADERPLAIFLMGPTASGKTALACDLAERFDLGLISVDSALVYRGLDIGTAKPDQATLRRFPHRLIDIRDPSQPYSAAEFRSDAVAAMSEFRTRGRTPLLVGGTGLYFRALQRGLSPLPQGDPDTRARFAAAMADEGLPRLHARLAELDPPAAARIRATDTQRVLRALEVIELTGMPLSDQQGLLRERLPWRVLKLALMPADREPLRERIEQRFDAMLAAGFLDELASLRNRGDLTPDLPATRAVGYRQAWQHFDGSISLDEFRQRAIFATRQLAKRQITWLRAELDARVLWTDRADSGRFGPADVACHAVSSFLSTGNASR
ncbi:MAG: tRNA (adenosine(37)-N6)-dimethylallyltransferase MiaA [Dokdonella sp.]